MATGKRYYWIKLKESFMTSETVDYLMSQEGGANYVVLYQMLCLKTINTGGRLSRTIGEIVIPYDAEKIQRDCKWFSIDTVRIAMTLYRRLGLIYEELDGTLVLADHDSLVGSETDFARQKRNQRENSTLPCGQCPPDCPPDIVDSDVENLHTDIRDKILEIRDQSVERDTEKEKGTTVDSAEPVPGSTPPTDPAVISMPLNDGTEYGVTQAEIDKYSSLYPAVNILQELRDMVGWLDANPNRKKTRKGIKRFINNWLSTEQDRGGTLRRQTCYPQPSPAHQADTRPPVQGNPFADYLEDNP